jgi:hypothetical protein
MNINNILISKNNIYIVFLGTFFILLLPLIAMQFTKEVNWSVGDFVVAGVLLSFFCYIYKVLTKSSSKPIKNIVIGLIVFALFIFVWVSFI